MVAVAGSLNAVREGIVSPDSRVVCLVTGSGFKDASSVDRMLSDFSCETVDLSALEEEVPDSD